MIRQKICVPPSPVAALPGEVLFGGTICADGVAYETAVVRWDGAPRTYRRDDVEWIHVREDGPAGFPIILAWAERGHTKAAQAYREVAEGLEREHVLQEQLAVARTGTEDVWRWIGDGNDHPESLSCPVVMSAETLRGFVADRERAERAEKAEHDADNVALAARALLDSIGEYVRQSMQMNPEWRSGIAAVEDALGLRGVRAEVRLMRERYALRARAEAAEAELAILRERATAEENTAILQALIDEVQALRAQLKAAGDSVSPGIKSPQTSSPVEHSAPPLPEGCTCPLDVLQRFCEDTTDTGTARVVAACDTEIHRAAGRAALRRAGEEKK